MTYRLQLDVDKQIFIAIDAHNTAKVGKGKTIEQAVAALKN